MGIGWVFIFIINKDNFFLYKKIKKSFYLFILYICLQDNYIPFHQGSKGIHYFTKHI